MSWNHQKSLQRIQKHLKNMGEIEVSKLTREANLEELLSETVCRDFYGVHVYDQVMNFPQLVSNGKYLQNDYKRLIQGVHIYQRAVAQMVRDFGGLCIHFQGSKLHALFYHPVDDSRRLAIRAILLQLALKDFVQTIFNRAFPYDFAVAGGADLGHAIGTSDGIKGDRELLFLGSPANHAAKIIGSAHSLHLTSNIYSVLPNDLRGLCTNAGQDFNDQKLYQLKPVTSTTLDNLLKSYGISWKRDVAAKYVQDEIQRFPLKKIVCSSAEAEINLDDLSIGSNKRVLAASIFADVSGFTHYIDAAKSKNEKLIALKVFHAIRKEMALVIKSDYNGLRIQYQGDRVQGLFHLPKDDKSAIAEKAVHAAVGLQSSMQYTLKRSLPKIGELQLKVGIDMGITLVSKLGIRGQRDLICLGEAVENAALCEEHCQGGQIGITKQVFQALPSDLRNFFKYNATAQCYTAELIYEE